MAYDVDFDTEGTMRNFIDAYEMAEEDEPAITFIEAIANSIDAHAIDIQISMRQKQDGRGVLKITDDGDGMTEKNTERKLPQILHIIKREIRRAWNRFCGGRCQIGPLF